MDLDKVYAADVALGYRRQADMGTATAGVISNEAASFLSLVNRVMLREYTEPSWAEAMAMKESKGSSAGDLAMILRGSRIVPEPDKA